MPPGDLSARIAAWPEPLRERVSVLRGGAPRRGAEFVLYWMRIAARGHENPALDAALALGAQLELPVFVYHALDERYPFASDRHHTFILEGARDVSRELAERGIGYAFHLARPGQRGPHLATLAARAAALVTEDAPIGFLARWTRAVAERSTAPVIAVDASCVVPMPLVPRAFERAFAFRRATEALRATRVARPWADASCHAPSFLPELPFEPAALAEADLAALVAECEIDHGVAPVPHTRGGSRAGYARWNAFRDEGLRLYHRRRNDPLCPGTSRLSAYLHYGHVSPFRIAREAAAEGSEGGRKFLDELLVWRELAWHFCRYRNHDSVEALPDWARRTLADHEGDRRPALPSWETLARGRTGDRLWDAAQRSLLVHGELHNNLRMTWGKALPGWTRNAAEALARLEDLNHRYALDGRDPASYGGLLWCLGQFDRPFTPDRPVIGTLRPRDTDSHARRLDVARFAERTARAALPEPPRVAVVGAGVAGLACARTLADHGIPVRVFDKARGPGGRAATRRSEHGRFDHGAQYFTARDPHFARYVRSWQADGLVAPWLGRIVRLRAGEALASPGDAERFVAVPRMSALARHLAADLDLTCGVRVAAVAGDGPAWRLAAEDGEELGAFDGAVVATPAAQAAPLLAVAPELAAAAGQAELAPCLAAMAAFAAPIPADFDAAFVDGSPLAWISREASRPGREPGERWVLHASPKWSTRHLEEPPERFAAALIEALREAVGAPLPEVVHLDGQRWRYARATKPLPARFLYDADLRIGACGDWCGGDRVEAAWRSGVALAGRILGAEGAAARPAEPSAARQGELWAEGA